MQGRDTPVPASVGSVKAGSPASLSNDRSAMVVDHLATVVPNASSEGKKFLDQLGAKITELLNYVKPRHNVHHEIKRLAKAISLNYDQFRLTECSVVSQQPRETRLVETQTTSRLHEQQNPEPLVECNTSAKRETEESSSKGDVKNRRRTKRVEKENVQNEQETQSSPAITVVPPTDFENAWEKVERKKKKESGRYKARPPRPDALVVKAKEGTSYADILRVMKNDPELQDVGASVSKIRKSASGSLLLVLNREAQKKTEDLRIAVAEKLRDKAEVNSKTETTWVELKDLDELTEATEVLQAIRTQVEGAEVVESSAVKSLRKAYGGTQTAVLVLPVHIAKKVLEKGKIRVGWVVSRVRKKETTPRCYRCLGFGHMARLCTGPDRSKLCRRCGEEGHIAKCCKKEELRCLLCGENSGKGHATGNYNCPVYQQTLKTALKHGI